MGWPPALQPRDPRARGAPPVAFAAAVGPCYLAPVHSGTPDDVGARASLILDCAAQLASEGGPGAVRMRDIAARSGIALGTLYRQFASKDEVLIALLEREVGFLERSMAWIRASGDTYVQRAMGFYEPVTRIMCGRENLTRALLGSVAAGNAALADRVSGYHARTTALVASVLEGREVPKAEPRALDRAQLEVLAYMTSQSWFAALVGWMGGLFGPDMVIANVERATTWLVRGALADV